MINRDNYKEIRIKSILGDALTALAEDICDNYCKYRNTADEECLCELLRNGEKCPLDVLT